MESVRAEMADQVRWMNYDLFGLLTATKHVTRSTRPRCEEMKQKDWEDEEDEEKEEEG